MCLQKTVSEKNLKKYIAIMCVVSLTGGLMVRDCKSQLKQYIQSSMIILVADNLYSLSDLFTVYSTWVTL